MQKKQTSSWLKGVDAAELEKIRAAVASAELKTSGEIVPMIVRSSVSTGHVSWIVLLSLLLLFWLAVPTLAIQDWLPGPPWAWDLAGVALAAALTPVLSRLDLVKRLCTSAHDQIASAERRAQLEFFLSDIKKTEASTGVLLFVSMLERQVVILADKAISDRLPAETWKNIVSGLVAKIRVDQFAIGMSEAVAAIGELLEKSFPRAANDRNELADQLIVKD